MTLKHIQSIKRHIPVTQNGIGIHQTDFRRDNKHVKEGLHGSDQTNKKGFSFRLLS